MFSHFQEKLSNKAILSNDQPILAIAESLPDEAKSILQKIIGKVYLNSFGRKINELAEKCKQFLMLSAEGLTDKEITLELDYKRAGIVKTSRLRCMEKLHAPNRMQKAILLYTGDKLNEALFQFENIVHADSARWIGKNILVLFPFVLVLTTKL